MCGSGDGSAQRAVHREHDGRRTGQGLSFLPPPLPPDPPVRLENLWGLLEHGERWLGRLDGVTMHMPDPTLLLSMYVRKEALLSSQIEGTQSSLSELLLYENERAPGPRPFPWPFVVPASLSVGALTFFLLHTILHS